MRNLQKHLGLFQRFHEAGNNRMAMAVCLSGDAEGLLLEFETLLKSILHNAPFQTAIELYVVADDRAAAATHSLLDKIKIGGRPWRVPVTLNLLNVEALTAAWHDRLISVVPKISQTHTFGSLFRLFLAELIGRRTRHLIYTDTDVVFLAPLSGLWEQRSEDVMFCWGETRCTGVMVINLDRVKREFWSLVTQSIDKEQTHGDQTILRAIHDFAPDRFKWLSPAWDVHLADGLWRHGDKLPENKPAVGYLHFNGGGASKEAYFRQDDTWAFRTRGWNLASYYVGLPWPWLFYMGELSAKDLGRKGKIIVSHEVF